MTKKIILGSMESDAPGDIITLLGAPPNGQYETLQTDRAGTGGATTNYYQVPTGYKLVITSICFNCIAAGSGIVIGYGGGAVAAGVTAPTNAVGLTSQLLLKVGTANVMEQVPVCLIVPAGKYPYGYGVGSVDVMASGFLQRT
jgi:hypothetical protein